MHTNELFVAALLFIVSLCAPVLETQAQYPVHQVTSHPAQEGFPAWSPDGETIVYSFVSRDSAEMTGLWKVPADGGEPRQFTHFIGEHPNWSLDGHYIVFDADSGNSIKLISSHGGQPIRIVPKSIPVYRGGNPNWSPDGSRIAFKEGSNLWVLDIRTGDAEIVFSQENTYPIPGCWSHDGNSIYVTVRAVESPAATIWKVSLTGAEPLQLTFERARPYRYMDLSPDGTLLAFVACEGRNCDLWIMPADGGTPIQITVHPAYDDTPRWSPDGTKIAFTSTRSDSFDVWVVDVDIEEIKTALESANQ
jgi:Tol biopolymer transport system component